MDFLVKKFKGKYLSPYFPSDSVPTGQACQTLDATFERSGGEFKGFRFYVGPRALPQASEDFCQAEGGYLPVLTTLERHRLLKSVGLRYGEGY